MNLTIGRQRRSGDDGHSIGAKVFENARCLSDVLMGRGPRLVGGGTDTHMVLVDLSTVGTTGQQAEQALARAGITSNKNPVPFVPPRPSRWTGLRLGVSAATTRGFGIAEMEALGYCIADLGPRGNRLGFGCSGEAVERDSDDADRRHDAGQPDTGNNNRGRLESMNVIEAIRTKRAVRTYRDDPLPDDIVRTILHAGRRSQSAKNDQPWHFIAIRDRGTLGALAATSPNIAYIANAALCVALVTPPPAQRKTILFDAGQAAACMQLAAWELGVVSCLGTVWGPGKARAVLGFPDDLHLDLLVAFGYPLPEDAEPRQGRKGGRKALDDVVRWDRW